MKLRPPFLKAIKRHFAHSLLEAAPEHVAVEESNYRAVKRQTTSTAISEWEKQLGDKECPRNDLHDKRNVTSKNGRELRGVSGKLGQIKCHFAYLRKRDYRKIRSIIDSLQIGSNENLEFGGNIIQEAEKCGLDERTYHLAKNALQYKIDSKIIGEDSLERFINYDCASNAISKLAYREDRISSYILYRVTKKNDASIVLGGCSLQPDVRLKLNFQSQRDFAKDALKQRGWIDVDPLSDEYIVSAESRSNIEVAQLKKRYRELSRKKMLLRKQILLTL